MVLLGLVFGHVVLSLFNLHRPCKAPWLYWSIGVFLSTKALHSGYHNFISEDRILHSYNNSITKITKVTLKNTLVRVYAN